MTEIPHGAHRATYAKEMQEQIDLGMSAVKASAVVGKRHNIQASTAHAAYYEQRRAERGVTRSRRATGHYHAPAELADLLAELQATQVKLDAQIKAVVLWGQQAEARVERRALELIRAAAKD